MARLKSIDVLGSLTLIGCVAPLLLSLSFMAANDLSIKDARVFGNMIAGLACGVAFFFVETRIARNPVLPIHLVVQRTPGMSAISNFFLVSMKCVKDVFFSF